MRMRRDSVSFRRRIRNSIYAFGANRNQNDIIPDTILASAVTNIPRAFLDLATQIKAGSFHPAMIELGMKDGEVSVVYNPALLAKIPPSALDAAKSAEQEIIAGKLNVTKLAAASGQ